jgi:bis(5'-nucleosidyl)-tetraphosphatase
MKFETSFGIIPLIKREGEWDILLICHKKGHYWGFPKGHGDIAERPIETAARELYEETGLKILRVLSQQTLKECYEFSRDSEAIHKTVIYFLAEVKGQINLQSSEISESKWVKLSLAPQWITFSQSQELIKETIFLLPQ